MSALQPDAIQRRLSRLLPRGPRSAPIEPQFGAIPYATVKGEVAFLLITSRRSGRWIFPKGAMDDGKSGREQAAHEAYEEAGVIGEVEASCIGSYHDWKTRNLRRYPIEVFMYPLRVERQLDEWRESEQRYRHWALFPEARKLLTNASLIEMIAAIDRRVREGRAYTTA